MNVKLSPETVEIRQHVFWEYKNCPSAKNCPNWRNNAVPKQERVRPYADLIFLR